MFAASCSFAMLQVNKLQGQRLVKRIYKPVTCGVEDTTCKYRHAFTLNHAITLPLFQITFIQN